jgi:HAD superfamily hydrolase (TIGR01509 family)
MEVSETTHVIFDLDGTLLDTEPLYTEATRCIVQRYGKEYGWDIKRHIMGGSAEAGARFVIDKLNLPLKIEAYLEEREHVLRALCASAPACPGAEALVSALHARGIPMAIGTSGPRALTMVKLAPHAFARNFRAIVCSDDPGIGGAKPAPDIFLAAARALGAAPAACLVIEDSPKGLEAALAAGMRAIVVPDPHMRAVGYPGAERVVDSLAEVSLASLGLD